MSQENPSASPAYRIYRMDFDGCFIEAEVIYATNDLEAVTQARQKLDGKPIELWSGDRLMVRLMPKDDAD